MSMTEAALGAPAPSLRVRVGGQSVAGVREANQDAFAVRIPDKQAELEHAGIVACIADGVSCSENGQQASHTAVTQFIDDYYAAPATWGARYTVGKVLNALNQWLFAQGDLQQLNHNGLITTLTAVVIKSNTAHIAHVGDSRLYHCRGGRMTQLTQDHRRRHIGNKSFLTRALGMDSRLDVDFQQIKLEAGDRLVMTTDGVHDWLTDRQLDALLSKYPQGNTELPPEQLTETIIAEAMAAGSNDNASCLVIDVDDLPSMSLPETIAELTQRAIPPVMDVGNRIDQYQVIRVLHSGARSHVYLAKSLFDSKTYVLKAPSLNFSEDYQYLQAFVREGWLGEQINHPSIMKIHPFSRASSFLYHVCDYIEGITLRQWMYENPQPELYKVRALVGEIIKSLRVYQRNGVIHRDLKPENIIIGENNRVTIIDLGTAKVSGLDDLENPIKETLPVGDIKYISPECLTGNKITFKSDMFSLAVMVYEMLSGHYPYSLEAMKVLAQDRRKYPKYTSLKNYRDDLPIWVDLVVKKGCNLEENERYQAFSEFFLSLEKPTPSIISNSRSLPLKKKNPVLFWKFVSVFLLVVIFVLLLWEF
ncbi:bifunctional protein-serine/threonine kinase/phosphatase [Photobacterium sanctipauli]|uniref:non-specific serine/threonine protein kinase n=2 Tax=Photobacterium sanctipauli TaxID=1342794 RepID=A0A2T3NQA4_9GAMM|nr:bifunctional protein-serine/threonine kinase/phosphatase [Photobacterium sanctipauli]